LYTIKTVPYHTDPVNTYFDANNNYCGTKTYTFSHTWLTADTSAGQTGNVLIQINTSNPSAFGTWTAGQTTMTFTVTVYVKLSSHASS